MIVGTCRIELHIPESGSLKQKRKVIKALKDRIKNRFNVSIAEIEYQDLWQRTAFGIAMVSNDAQHIDTTISHIINLIDSEYRVEILDHKVEWR